MAVKAFERVVKKSTYFVYLRVAVSMDITNIVQEM